MKRKYSKAIKKIAKQEEVSPEYVYEEMQKAISEGYFNPDPEIQKYWREITPDGKMPPPEQVLEALVNQIKKKK